MSKIISLISGKGGSGKTSLSLSMASMLSNCGVKVLLIDCDLTTNGATYFYEDKLTEGDNPVVSFYDIVFHKENSEGNLINAKSNMDFIPSIVQINKKNTKTYIYNEDRDENLQVINEKYGDIYDVIIFDCQAGYADILKLVLPITDIILVVMETDAISSSSIRSLYLKIGDLINEKKIFQVFNKVNEEDYDIYSKISGGIIFTNIETVLFDWKVRQAFSLAEIPDMENTSVDYGVKIYNICKVMLKDKHIQNKLNKYKAQLELKQYNEKKKKLNKKINNIIENKYSVSYNFNTNKYTSLLMIIILTICSAILLTLSDSIQSPHRIILIISIFVIEFLEIFKTMFNSVKNASYNKKKKSFEIETAKKELDSINEEIQKLSDTSQDMYSINM
ncbi:MAG: ParA family protein [Faecalibacterium sp.]|nr:ParA family protein [Ruminococcus sp.]MCM1391877.1 ParA family protein [Ruminococcus sp.]MCM1485547.1 ParA family protein [Faecalibacterium sp.]